MRMVFQMKDKPTAMQVAIYDMGKNDLPDKLVKEVETAVVNILKQHTTVAHTVVMAND
jgi:hypothetical protein